MTSVIEASRPAIRTATPEEATRRWTQDLRESGKTHLRNVAAGTVLGECGGIARSHADLDEAALVGRRAAVSRLPALPCAASDP
jgi:hypothetical protein